MDYDLEIMLVALVAHRLFEGGSEESVSEYATDLFNRYDAHIVKACHDAGIGVDVKKRSIIASVAAMVPGTTAKDSALEAVATYVQLLDS